ncbi:TPA: hypothetical protein KDX74_000559 [Vibrio parahaemolyticus]|uniref:hypothetical protein n=1 Tax=Vibrio parahaemolyticus TaxID=670 RepID=UPI0015F69DF1|nr:hypothetical protein [Vibrio parahaemolyticus]MCI9703468.1 hypothetical protein [Vibrio parahaemolyticus]MDF4637898.1 hypothetical protein [Vibrio parahaemolyticus]MDF5481606.1 hypothetical protein [Vibrio parahaemolyticus]MDG2620754.1 hypothetical protein [Vibrio parahaemolyticus]MDG2836456.1 hypothetical protein [Vibrio parahaemolyticus]
MEDLKQKYEMLYANLDATRQQKLDELVNEWLPIYKQDLDCVLANTDYIIEQNPKLIPVGGGLSVAKMRFQAYLKHSQTSKIILLDVGFNAYKNKPEKERMPYLNNWLERSLLPPKRQKPVKTLSERFTKMLKDFDAGYAVDKHMPTLTEVNRLIPHLKNDIKFKGQATVYDWFYNTKISHSELCVLIQETHNRLTRK